MEPFTVLLLYPDYLSENYGEETYTAWVDAYDPTHAVKLAQQQALRAQSNDRRTGASGADFRSLAVFEGHLSNLNPL